MFLYSHPYFVGIGGIGMSALARALHARGTAVCGYDAQDSNITAALRFEGIPVSINDKAALPTDTDVLVYSDAIAENHWLRIQAAHRNIASLNYAQALGHYVGTYTQRIAVAGTNGKTTTTAMLGWILIQAGLDPTIIVGSLVPQLNSNMRLGQSPLIVVEADEYRNHFLEIHPTLAMITNIDFDHPDFFQDIHAVKHSFAAFISSVPDQEPILANADDAASRVATHNRLRKQFSITADPQAEVRVNRTAQGDQVQHCRLIINNKETDSFDLHLPGEMNRANAAAAALAAWHLGVAPTVIAHALSSFQGTWRRFEHIGTFQKAAVISDYAHHPAGVRLTLQAAREWFPNKRIVAVFQPHQRERLARLMNEFASAFSAADETIITETYAVPGRDREDTTPTLAHQLARRIGDQGQLVHFTPDTDSLREQMKTAASTPAALIVMGAGSIDSIVRSFIV